MKRFYKEVSVEKAGDVYLVKLDKSTVKTPSQNPLVIASKNMAEAIAKEWDTHDEDLDMSIMPLTQMLNTQIDKVSVNRSVIEEQILKYAESDLVCYYAEEPADLVQRQKDIWGGLLSDWLKDKYDVTLRVTSGIHHVEQSVQDLEALRVIIKSLSLERLTALHAVAPVGGSLVIGLAFIDDHLSPEEAVQAIYLDEIYQAERWGEDEEGLNERLSVTKELRVSRKFLDLLS